MPVAGIRAPIARPWVAKPIWHPSPNFGPRRGGGQPRLIVLHYTAMNSAQAALQRLCDPGPEVSAHYLVAKNGLIYQMVEEAQRAWHAGAGQWGGCADVNSASIGIELDNDGQTPFAAPMMDALEQLLPPIMARWDIPPQNVIGHQDMAPLRKCDPGSRFDWRRLARGGMAIWPNVGGGEKAPETVMHTPCTFHAHLMQIGFPDAPLADLLRVFRWRFRPGACGPLGAADFTAAMDLAERFPVDPALALG
jgi:N-acetylmuramoyl-L-alanine amidase